jgi:hypothetical protein
MKLTPKKSRRDPKAVPHLLNLVGVVSHLQEQVTGVSRAGLGETEQAFRGSVAIVRCSDNAILSKALECPIQTWNGGTEKIYGYRAEEAIGKSISPQAPGNCASELYK